MPTISLNVKVFLLLLASAAGVLASVLGNVLAPNILYRISKRGRPPTARSPKVWAAFAGSAGIFVIVGTLAAVAPLSPAHDGASGVEDLEIVHIAVSTRRPLWDIEWLDKDEIVAVVRGTGTPKLGAYRDSSLVAFWRLATGYETNWHVGRRRVGGNYELALLPADNALSKEWEFFVGGMECRKDYSGDVGIVILLVSPRAIEANASEWLDDKQGWGFENLPFDGVIQSSQMKTFRTVPVRE